MKGPIHPVRRLRLLLDLDQFTVGAAAGKSASWISALERGRTQADTETLVRLAAALGVSPKDLRPEQEETLHD